ncbi:hypothetical protein P691DRAFT_853979 [Macrolepiota fuliginosa MF-IS2]|uniref:Serine-threonine/tyrosine-protein kinase catalytic domain-containing protein n=1 Tax=Macrolepiota fuliginosa MF-IS2 TaxID=1400762 RepID=A0A9P5WZS4_9AGAR|nr:hypothetical protein P691DRAFT_853979 [Macrolepiota fuliginosa MF-IS2]
MSCGCSYHWAAPEPIEEEEEDAQIIRKLIGGKLPSGSDTAICIDDDMRDLMKRCWNVDPVERPSSQEILDTSRFRGIHRETGDNLSTVEYHKQQFKAATAEGAVDLAFVGGVLDEVRFLNLW